MDTSENLSPGPGRKIDLLTIKAGYVIMLEQRLLRLKRAFLRFFIRARLFFWSSQQKHYNSHKKHANQEKIRDIRRKKITPDVGIEPTTTRLKVERSSN